MMKHVAGLLAVAGLSGMLYGAASSPEVKLTTSYGDIVLRLDAAKAPKTVANFLQYVSIGFYDGTIFHRVIKTFMIQGGGLTADMTEKPAKDAITNEASNGLKNLRGTVAMARKTDPNSATAQFFINTVDNAFLDHRDSTEQGFGYCVFGRVVKGLNVVDSIAKTATTSKEMYQDIPSEPILIKKATVVKAVKVNAAK